MTPYPFVRYTKTSYEQELRRVAMRKGLAWAVFLFLIATNILTAVALVQARHKVASVVGKADGCHP